MISVNLYGRQVEALQGVREPGNKSGLSRLCSICSSNLDKFNKSAKSSYCRGCYNAIYRHKLRPGTKQNKKHSARIMAMKAVKMGVIIKTPCLICGSNDSQMHHPNYNKPLDVSWLCRKCHIDFHTLENKVLSK